MWWLLEPWIALIAGMAQSPSAPRRLGVVHASDDDGPKLQFRVFGPDWPEGTQQAEATALLTWMVECYQAGMDAPIAVLPQTSFQFAWGIQAWNATRDRSEHIGPEDFEPGGTTPSPDALGHAMTLARKAWGTADSRFGDSKEVHINHLYGSARPFLEDESSWPPMPNPLFAASALRLWLPLIATRQKISLGRKGLSPFLDALHGPEEA